MQLIERVEIIGNYKSKIGKATSRTRSGLSLRMPGERFMVRWSPLVP